MLKNIAQCFAAKPQAPQSSKVCYIPPEQWKQNKKRWFAWADSLSLKLSVRQTLKAIISVSSAIGVTGATITAINFARSKERLIKADGVSDRTIIRHLDILEDRGYISRTTTKTWKSHNTIAVLMPTLVEQPLKTNTCDIMSPVIIKYIKHDHNDSIKTQEPQATSQAQDLQQRLADLGIFLGLIFKWLKKHHTSTIEQQLNYVLSTRGITNKGAYMSKIMEQLDKPKEEKRYEKLSHFPTPGVMETEINSLGLPERRASKETTKSNLEAIKRMLKKSK